MLAATVTVLVALAGERCWSGACAPCRLVWSACVHAVRLFIVAVGGNLASTAALDPGQS